MTVSISLDLNQEARELDHMCTIVANAYIRQLMARYLETFEARLHDVGLRYPILLMTSSGGMYDLGAASFLPIRLLVSGPAPAGHRKAACDGRMDHADTHRQQQEDGPMAEKAALTPEASIGIGANVTRLLAEHSHGVDAMSSYGKVEALTKEPGELGHIESNLGPVT